MKQGCFMRCATEGRIATSRRSVSIFLLLFASVIIASIPTYGAGMPSWTEVPIFTDAALKEGSSTSGSVSSAQASRFYSIDLSEAGLLTVEVSGSSETNGTLTLYDSDAVTQLGSVRLASTASYSVSAHLLKGRYYAKVTRSANEWSFQLNVSSSRSTSADQESNDTFFEALSSKVGQQASGCLGFQGNGYVDARDWWRVDVDDVGLLKIDLQVSSESAKGMLRLYDASGTHQLTSVGFDGSKSRYASVEYRVSASTFYVQIERSAGAFEYQMTPSVQGVTVAADKEPNDYYTVALNMVSGSSVTGALGHYADGVLDAEDWWHVKPNGTGMIIVTASIVGQSEGKGTLQVMSADWQETKSDSLDSSAGKRNASVTLSPRKDMSYYVRVQRTAGAWSYSLNATFAQTQLDRHPSEDATLIQLPGQVSGQINSAKPTAWHYVTVPSNGTLDLSFAADTDPGCYFRLYDTNARRALKDEWVSGKEQTAVSRDLAPGTYYVEVARNYSRDFSYTITAGFKEAPWQTDREPNDLPSFAVDLQVGGSMTGHMGYPTDGRADDADWHKVNVTQDGLLSIDLETTADPGSYLRLYDCNGATVLVDKWVTGVTKVTIQYKVAPGTYYVQLLRYYSDRIYSYKLSAKLEPALYDSDQEPNDSVTKALRLGIKGIAEGHIGYYSNRYSDAADWYYIDIAQNGLLKVTLECSDDPGSYLKLYDTNGTREIANLWMSGTTQGSVAANLRPGRYFVKIERNYSNPVYSYKLTPTFTPAELDSDREPNNHVSQALDVPANGMVTGNIGYYSNSHVDTTDWYRVRIPTKSVFVVSLAPTASPGSYLKVYNEDLKELHSQWIEGEKTAGQVKLVDIDPGVYYVSVSQYYSGRIYSYVLTTATYQSSDRLSVVTTYPSDGSRLDNRSLIVVPLAGEIDRNSVTQDTVRVTTVSGNRVSGTVVCPGNTIVFYPDQKLTDGERYSVTLAGTIKGVDGTALGTGRTFSFTPAPEAVIEVPADSSQDRLAGYAADRGSADRAGRPPSASSGPRSATLSVSSAGLGPLSMLRVAVSEIAGMDEVVAFRLDDSNPVEITDAALLATVSSSIAISFLDAEGNVVESSVIPAQADPEVRLDFSAAEAHASAGEQRVVGSVGVARLGFLNTIRVTVSQVSGIEGAARFRVDDGSPVSIGGTSILVTLEDKFMLHIEDDSGKVLLSEELPAESNPELILVYQGKVELPANHVLVGDTAISIDLFFDQPEAAGQRVNEALMSASDPAILVYIEGSDITDAFTGEAASEEQVERMRENLMYVVDSNNEKREI